MNIAVLKQERIIDCLVFDSLDTAQLFLQQGIFNNADDVKELPEGFGIGDKYINDQFKKSVKSDVDIKNEQKQQILQDLENLDKKSIRDAEDLTDLLIQKNIIKENELPAQVKNRTTQKKALRQQLKDLEV